ncbi:tocopherol cyclase-like protein [Rhodococcus sp. OK519]|uniref:tocopherol cyclase family protein n=1 Tax=Rhodococcus sp. OK519 TaxID=2135729 RepID=UPI000D364A72|nr:tocopherol cyclase-like protein [Rhodococcus sp. OK519]
MPGLLARYRRTGADVPFGNPLAAHDVAMEGYFWRFTQRDTGRVLIALAGINRAADGQWATLGMGAHPGGFLRTAAHPVAGADPDDLGAFAGDAFHGTRDRLRVDLGPGARIDARITDRFEWPRRRFGGSSGFHTVPALNQYWHPWLLGGRVEGWADVDGERWDLDGAQVYGEKNWGRGGFPDAWWWGQAQGFDDPRVCVAFAGGIVTAGPLRTEVTAVVVALPDGTVIRVGNPVVSPVRAEVDDESWLLSGGSRRWSVEIRGEARRGDAHVLPVPLPAERRNMPGALEHLGGKLSVTVSNNGRCCLSGASHLAGLEWGGISRAHDELRRRERADGDTQN